MPGRHAGRTAVLSLPLVAVVVIAILASGVVGTLSAFTASIVNPTNAVRSASVGLTETAQGGATCSALGDSQWHDCVAINKYGAASLASGGSSTTTVTIRNTGSSPAQLSLLPSECSDTLTGARGVLCGQVAVTVTCGGSQVVASPTLNAFHDGRNFPAGYPAGTLAGGATVTCTFTQTAGTVSAPGAVSQPISWKLTAT